MWKQDHVANAWAVSQEHDQSINSDAATSGRGHAVFKRPNVISVVKHCLFVTSRSRSYLRIEACLLIFWVINLLLVFSLPAVYSEQNLDILVSEVLVNNRRVPDILKGAVATFQPTSSITTCRDESKPLSLLHTECHLHACPTQYLSHAIFTLCNNDSGFDS